MKGHLIAAFWLVLLLATVFSGCADRVQAPKNPADRCVTNLTQIWWGLEKWIDDGIRFPPSLGRLAEVGSTPDIFICPGSNHPTAAESSVEDWGDFIYIAGEEEGDDLELAILISPPENHGGSFALVMWKGGYASRVSPEQARRLIREPWCMVKNIKSTDIDSLKKRLSVRVPSRWHNQYPYALNWEIHKSRYGESSQ